MANVATRRLLNKNLFKLKDFTHIFKHNRCTSIFFINCRDNKFETNNYGHQSFRCSTNSQIRLFSTQPEDCEANKKKPSLFQRFKQMYKDYWYVLVPVHLVTSAAWFGGFYYLAKSGVDIVAILESWNVSDKITNPLKDSSMGYLAVSYALYKIATPARYTITLGGTTISINYLKKWGYIKPVPSKERLKEMYLEKKDNLLETMRETREGFKLQSEKLKDKKENIIDDFDKSIKQIKELGDKIKSKEHMVEELKKKVTKTSKE
ncbi:C18orf19 -like B [Asbolus verrucosus]|uniref:C18orf19-like B n=1 Tax=Asbolus verrucosus TaxID=1661398 RepID=A0A482VQ11_ASBVE|nr:C18orf19 -like B [Asbolus verrucosus]